MKKNYLFYGLILLTSIISFIYVREVVTIARETLELVLFNLFPTLFPFMCLLMLSLKYGLLELLGHFLNPMLSFLHLSKTGLSLFLSSLFSGYPTNVKLMLEAYKDQKISLNESYTLLKCASFASPSFILVSLKIPSDYLLPVYLSHLFPPILYLILFHRQKKDNRVSSSFSFPKESFVSILKTIFVSCLYPFIFIYGFMLVFRVLTFLLSLFLPSDLVFYLQGFLEFSSGLLVFMDHFPLNQFSISMIPFFLSFSGFSVLMQCDSLLDTFPHSLGMLVKYRLLHGVLSFMICFLILIFK